MEKGKILAVTIMALCLVPIVRADNTTVSVEVWSEKDIFLTTNLNANGSTSVTIDGTNVNSEFGSIWTHFASFMSWGDLTYIFDQVAQYFYGKAEFPHPTAVSIFNSLNAVFMNKIEGQLINTKLNILNTRVTALEKAVESMNKTAWCNGRIETMREFNLTSVTCGNTTYYNQNSQYIMAITPVER